MTLEVIGPFRMDCGQVPRYHCTDECAIHRAVTVNIAVSLMEMHGAALIAATLKQEFELKGFLELPNYLGKELYSVYSSTEF